VLDILGRAWVAVEIVAWALEMKASNARASVSAAPLLRARLRKKRRWLINIASAAQSATLPRTRTRCLPLPAE